MTLTSADFAVHGTGSSVFQDDLQEVPLQSSVAASASSPTAEYASPSSPAPGVVPARTETAPFPNPHRAALCARVHSPESTSDSAMGWVPVTVFTVDTTSTLKSFPKAHCTVKRRFSDFAAMRDALYTKYAGYFVPPCPHKDLLQGKVMTSKAFLTKRAQELEVFLSRCCKHTELQQSKALTLFLTLQLDGAGLLAHPEWKQVQAEEPLFRSFQLVRAPRPPRESANLPNVAAKPASLAKLGWQVMQGVTKLGKRVHSSLSSSPQLEQTGHSALDSVNSEVQALEQRFKLYATLLQRWTETAQQAEYAAIGLEAMRDVFDHLAAHEAAAGSAALLSHAERSRQQGVELDRLARACACVAQLEHTFTKVADSAALPWRHLESGLRASQDACAERTKIMQAVADLEKLVQHKREQHRILAPQTSESAARGEAVATITRDITQLEEQLRDLRTDFRIMRDVNEDEMTGVKRELQSMGPLAALQVAQAQQQLCHDAARHWEQLARQLGAGADALQS